MQCTLLLESSNMASAGLEVLLPLLFLLFFLGDCAVVLLDGGVLS